MEFDPPKVPDTQPKRPAEPSEEEPKEVPKLREISPEKLKHILEDHKKWVESEGKEGKQADLTKATLQKVHLGEANLQEAHLFRTNLQGANLEKVLFTNASFKDATLREANFQDADLTDATGLLANQFAGANVSGAKLPDKIAKFEGLIQVEELSKGGKKLFISMLLGCVYAWLTIATTTDVALLTNSSSSPLPIIQAKIPIAGFYWTAPLILFSLFVWFHFYLQRFWQGLSNLPATFQDGQDLDEKAYPWLLNCLVRPHFTLLRKPRPPLSRLMVGISIILAWWLVPLTFVFFWLRYLPRHDWGGTGLHLALLVMAITCAIRFQHLAKLTLRGHKQESLRFKETWKTVVPYLTGLKRTWKISCTTVFTLLFVFVVSDGAINGIGTTPMEENKKFAPPAQFEKESPLGRENSVNGVGAARAWYKKIVPIALHAIGASAFADFTEQEVSTKPPNWFRDGELPRLVTGAQLKERNLRYLSASGAFLVKADLRKAILQGGDLSGAKLHKANLREAQLRKAYLRNAELQGAILFRAQLQGVNLNSANLEGAELRGAQLQGASLVGVLLTDANLDSTQLQGANLRLAQMHGANLSGAQLQGANLGIANLENAIFGEINGIRTNLRGANLSMVLSLTQDQLNEACVDDETILREGFTPPAPCPKEALSQK